MRGVGAGEPLVPFVTATLTAADVARLPAASRATAVRVCVALVAVVVVQETL